MTSNIFVEAAGGQQISSCYCCEYYRLTSNWPITDEMVEQLRADKKIGFGQMYKVSNQAYLAGSYTRMVTDYIDSSD